MRIRPCIDLHNSRVKQIVGSTLKAEALSELKTNFDTDKTSAYYAEMYRRDGLPGVSVYVSQCGSNIISSVSSMCARERDTCFCRPLFYVLACIFHFRVM